MNSEQRRLAAAREGSLPWKKWGPYLSERQWGTVREDYSEKGDAWDYFSHDQARSRAYRWGEDGLAGFSDERQRLCFALALWNGRDPILKERLFGLTNSEGNHGEDVKEYYFYLDSTPTHSYLKYLYKYPQAAYPYEQLIAANRGRSRKEFEYELIDTGVFAGDRYFDVFVEYAKATPEDILIEITAHNRGSEAAELHLLPTLWFRNQWSTQTAGHRPALERLATAEGPQIIQANEAELGSRFLYVEGAAELLFTENETNTQRIFGVPNRNPYVKDSFHEYVVHGRTEAVNPERRGTKAAAHYVLTMPAGGQQTVRLRLSDRAPQDWGRSSAGPFGAAFDEVLQARRQEADEFYAVLSVNMRALGTPVYSKRLFSDILAAFPDQAEICVMKDGAKPVAAALLLHGWGTTEVPTAASLKSYNPSCVNMLMYWQLLKRSIERGQKQFDFGRSTTDGNTFRYKKQWGATPSPATWQYAVKDGETPSLRPDNPRYERAIRLWQKLPVKLTQLIGPPIVRGIP